MGDEVTSRAVIIGSAPCESWENLNRYPTKGAYIIAADGGRVWAERAGLTVDWYVGDGDSGGFSAGLPSEVLPVEKDVTDLEAAVHHALERNIQHILLWGASGGRADHHLANLQLLEQIAQRGSQGIFLDAVNEVRYLRPGRYQIPNDPPYRYLGIIPLDARLTGVSIRGVKYPLDGATVRRGTTLTVSNEILPGCSAELTLGSGTALLVRSVPMERSGRAEKTESF